MRGSVRAWLWVWALELISGSHFSKHGWLATEEHQELLDFGHGGFQEREKGREAGFAPFVSFVRDELWHGCCFVGIHLICD